MPVLGGRGMESLAALRSDLTDYAAANLIAGIAGWLSVEIVWILVDDNGTAQDLRDGEPFVIERKPGISLVGQKRRHVTGMLRVEHVGGVIVHSGVWKAFACAVAEFMNMHRIIFGRAVCDHVREPEDFCFHQDTAVGSFVEFYQTA